MTIVSTSAHYNLSEIMSNAWSIVRQTGKEFSEALRSAWVKAKSAVKKLAIDVTKLAELSIQELKDLRAALDATIDMKESGEQPREKKFAHKIRLEEKNGKVYTTSYYNSCFVGKARGLRGKWDSGQWVFDASVKDHVVAAMIDCYGVSGIDPYEVCTLAVKGFSDSEYTGGIELFGRPVAKAWGRDSGAKAQEDIFILSGKITSGGSMKNWKTIAEDVDFEIHNFPVAELQNINIDSYNVEIKY